MNSVIVLNWNESDRTMECVRSLRDQTVPVTIVVVDNGSTDGSWERLSAALPDCVLLQSGANLGYAGGNNLGIRWAIENGANYVWILNNDTTVPPTALEQMLEFSPARNPAVVVPTIAYMESPSELWYQGGSYDWRRGRARHWGWHEPSDRSAENAGVSFASGCSMLVPTPVFSAVGLLCEDYFLYWEDVEFSARVAGAGYTIALASETIVLHSVGASSAAAEGFSPTYYYYNTRNRLHFIRRHHRGLARVTALAYTPRVIAGDLAKIIRSRSAWNSLKALTRGALAGLSNTASTRSSL